MQNNQLENPHAGDILKYEFLEPADLSQNQLAKAIKVPSNRIHAIVNGTRRITADTDLRLCKFFSLSEGFFLRLQMAYELSEVKGEMQGVLASIVPYGDVNIL